MPPATAAAANSQQAQQNLQNYTQGMQTPDQAMAAANGQFGVQGQQQQVQGMRTALQNTENLLNQVAPSVMGRTMYSDVSNAQATRQIANEQAPINTQLNTEQQDYSNLNQDYQNSVQQAGQLANANLTAQGQRQSYLQGIYNDLYTQEQSASQAAEAKREFDVGQANAQANAARGSAASSAADTKASLGQDIMNAFDNFHVRPNYYTENVIIPELLKAYPELDPATVQKQIYTTRKALGYG